MKLKNYKSGIICLLMAFWGLFSCVDSKTEKDQDDGQDLVQEEPEDVWELPQEDAMPFAQRIPIVLENLNELKAQAMASEQEKFSTTQLLIEELQALKVDESKVKSLQNALASAKEKVYTEKTMNNLEVMETYDESMDLLLGIINELSDNEPKVKDSFTARNLIKEIKQADSNDFLLRKDYNVFAREINAYLNEKAKEIENMGEPYSSLKEFPYFYGEPAM